ncbi:PASTA domain-containing protein [Duganella sp. CF517]|uniref:PASTA domain-containing protein n=1 Tax=Duganella sp. CF517 TaxID=1881038 RepID=UPI0008D1276E|nr:PASTA domain-containing protein [Duganella sp. CF517]SEN50579.1 PASTA domain-containing protein [Duganella sp. CF517]
MAISVPNVIGMARPAAESTLAASQLRYIARFPFSATGDGTAAAQTPTPGSTAPMFSVVTVSYPSPLGPLDDSPVGGPTLRPGTYEGTIKRVLAGNPFGSGQGAWIGFETALDGGAVGFTGVLYFDHALHPAAPPDRTEWMRRAAMLGIAQRAFTHGHRVRLVTANDLFIASIELFA